MDRYSVYAKYHSQQTALASPSLHIHMTLIVILLSVLLLAALTAFLAGQRGYDIMAWYLAGLVLGPLGLLAGLLPKRSHEPGSLFG